MLPRPLLSFTFVFLTLFLVAAAQAESKIIPGKRIGEIRIGMSHVDIIRLLGTPHHEEDLSQSPRSGFLNPGMEPLPKLDDILQDDWIKPLPASLNPDSDDPMFMCHFFTVYTSLKTGRVVQIEERDPHFQTIDKCSIESTALNLRKYHPQYKTTLCRYSHPGSGGVPAGKHFIDLEDAIDEGIAWRYGVMGNLAPDPEPEETLETIIVHAPGRPALIDPDGGGRFIWKVSPGRFGR